MEILGTGAIAPGCDDILLPGALEQVVQTYEPSGRRWVVVGIRWLDGCGTPRGNRTAPDWITVPMSASLGWNCIMHMATYVNSEMFLSSSPALFVLTRINQSGCLDGKMELGS